MEAAETLLHERIHQITHGNASNPEGKALRQALGRLHTRIGGQDEILPMADEAGIDLSGPLTALSQLETRNRAALLV